MSASRYEANIARQPALTRAVLDAPAPAWLKLPRGGIWLVGVGSNHHAARIAAWFWSRAGLPVRAVHSHDFARLPARVRRGEAAIFLSHGGGRSFTVAAEAAARRAGAFTIAVTARGSRWRAPRRLVTGPAEDTVAYTHSVTTTLAWLMRLPGRAELLAPFSELAAALDWGPAFPRICAEADAILIGDGPREWLAREAALKLQETACVRARAFGLEEFLHGPCASADGRSVVVAFRADGEPRWSAARAYLKRVGATLVEVPSENWISQLVWGQRLAAAVCRDLGVNPDLPRPGRPRYALARAELKRGLPR